MRPKKYLVLTSIPLLIRLLIVPSYHKLPLDCHEILVHDLEIDRDKGIFQMDGKPFTGISNAFYEDGSVFEISQYINGKRSGAHQRFFNSGILSYEANYLKGKLDGTVKSWWSNGKLRSISNFSDGVATGKQIQFYKSGVLFKEMHLVNGHEEGIQKSWRENGKLYNNYEVKNGRTFGLRRSKLCFKLQDEMIHYE